MKKKTGLKMFLVKTSVLVLVGFPLALIWGELFTRILVPQNLDSRMNIYEADPVIGFTYRPGARAFEKGREYNALYQINRVGLRDREYGPKQRVDFRILLLGDSFSASHGLPVEESLSRQIERALQAAADYDGMAIKIEVVNAAIGGYSPYNYWKAYRRWANVFRPDAVIIGLSPDDHDCSNEDARYVIRDGAIVAEVKKGDDPSAAQDGSIKRMRKWLSWNSEFYILLRNFVFYNDVVGFIHKRVNAKAIQGSQVFRFLSPQPEAMEKAWAKAFAYLRLLRNDAAKDGVEVIVVPIPSKIEIDPEECRRVLRGSKLESEQIDLGQPLRQIADGCMKERIPVLDPSAAIRRRHAEVPCYFVYDGHWVAEGIRAASASIAMQWRKLGLPPWSKAFREVENRSGEGEMRDFTRDALLQVSGPVDAQ